MMEKAELLDSCLNCLELLWNCGLNCRMGGRIAVSETLHNDCDRLKKTLPRRCWEETEEAYGARLKVAASYINSTHDVKGLCMEFPGRLRDLVERDGDRLAN